MEVAGGQFLMAAAGFSGSWYLPSKLNSVLCFI